MATPDLTPVQHRFDWAKAHAERVRELSEGWAASAILETNALDPVRGLNVYRAEVLGEPRLTSR